MEKLSLIFAIYLPIILSNPSSIPHTQIEIFMKNYSSICENCDFKLKGCLLQDIDIPICMHSFSVHLGPDSANIPSSAENPVILAVSYKWTKNVGANLRITKPNDRTNYIDRNIKLDPESRVTVKSKDDQYNYFKAILDDSRFILTYGLKVYCETNYFGDSCSTFCQSTYRYNCSGEGEKICNEGWKDPSKDCKIQVSICDRNADICMNGATCIPGRNPNDFKCRCSEGYIGTNCQYVNPCYRRPCENGGLCRLIEGNDSQPMYECDCKEGFYGENCTELVATTEFTSILTTNEFEFTQTSSQQPDETSHMKTATTETKLIETTEAETTVGSSTSLRFTSAYPNENYTRAPHNFPTDYLIFNKVLNETDLKLVVKVLRVIFNDSTNQIVIDIHPEIKLSIKGLKVTKITITLIREEKTLSNKFVYSTIYNRGIEWLNENMPAELYAGKLQTDNGGQTPEEPNKMKVVPIIIGVTCGVVVVVILIVIIQMVLYKNRKKRRGYVGSLNDSEVRYRAGEGKMSFTNPLYSTENIYV